jgi:tetratricopeptide (TPR) repeat protein
MSLNASCSISEGAIQSVAGKRKSDSLSKHSEDLAGSSENSKRKSIAKKSEDQNKRSYSRDLRSLDLENQPHVGSSHNISNPVGNTRLFRSPFGRISDHMEYFLKAIDLDPENSSAYSCLGSMLPKNGSIRLLNGQVMSKQDLFLKALDLNPESSAAYNNLALTLPDNGIIRLLNGRSMSKRELFLKALELKAKAA